ncbi:Protein of unknown function DUF2362 [Trinorchestia longiramus]|nr:Protein of unknown function DUF2362 [Trinorchestia longiramus]
MEGDATMLHDVEKEHEEDLLDWVACASDIDESAVEDDQDGEWKTTRNSRKRKEKSVEEREIQQGGKKKMHTSADGGKGSEKEKPYDNLCPSRVNRNLSFDRADASTSAQSSSLREKGEKGRVSKPNLGFNITKTMRSEDSKVILVCRIGMEAHTFTSDPVALAQGIEYPVKVKVPISLASQDDPEELAHRLVQHHNLPVYLQPELSAGLRQFLVKSADVMLRKEGQQLLLDLRNKAASVHKISGFWEQQQQQQVMGKQ